MDFFEQAINNYSGLSSETKPTIAAGNRVPNGSRWREVDTDKLKQEPIDLAFYNMPFSDGLTINITDDPSAVLVIYE